MILVNGEAVAVVDALDRGLAYGDGVFRTLRTHDRWPVWWGDHFAKLVADCTALNLACPAEALLHDEVCQVSEAGQGIIKILVTRGAGVRGYAPPVGQRGNRVVLSAPMPPHAQTGMADGIVARWCTLRLARQPRLAGIKHLNRLENVLARAEWDDPAIFEGLLCDDRGEVIGGVMSNVFWAKEGTLYTPELSECGVAGVTRARLLRAAARRNIPIRIGHWLPDAILAADEVMICNSVIGVRRITKLDDRTWLPAGWTTTLNNALHEEVD
jgi:4-amino-4-deoxychorismate lyase